MFDGTIQLRSAENPKKNYARPLPVTINIQWPIFTNETGGYSASFPPTWTAQELDSAVFFLSPLTNSKRNDPDELHVPPDIAIRVFANDTNLNIDDFVLQFDSGWFNRYVERNEFLIGGHAGIRFRDLGTEVGHAPVLATFVQISSNSVLLLTVPGYESDLTAERVQVYDQVIKTLTFE